MTNQRWTVRECPTHGLVSRLGYGLPDAWCPHSGCHEALSEPFDVMRVPSLEGRGQARRDDPATAKAAGEITVNRGSQRWKVLEAIRGSGARGATAGELAILTGVPYASLTPRIGELKRGHYIQATGETRPSKFGVAQEVLALNVDLSPNEQHLTAELDIAEDHETPPSDLYWGDE